MNDSVLTIDAAMQAQIDRLVMGELPEPERRNLLAWLDEDGRRWRMCALAFLECQTWEAAALDWSDQALTIGPGANAAVAKDHGPKRGSLHTNSDGQRRRVSTFAVAAAVLAAFISGAIVAQCWPVQEAGPVHTIVEQPAKTPDEAPPGNPRQPLLATVSVRSNLDPRVPLQLQVPVTAAESPSQSAAALISDYERQQWERAGFEVVEELRYLPATMSDGREVVVPVNTVRLKFKGIPVS